MFRKVIAFGITTSLLTFLLGLPFLYPITETNFIPYLILFWIFWFCWGDQLAELGKYSLYAEWHLYERQKVINLYQDVTGDRD